MHITRTRVRYSETDQMGVVYHANYLVYFEIGRTEIMREHGAAYADLEREGLRLAVVDAAVRYRGAASYDDAIRITTRITDVSGVRVRFDYTVSMDPDGPLLAEGHTTLASLDDAGRPRRMPPALRSALDAIVEIERRVP